jgi:hypothetical protein
MIKNAIFSILKTFTSEEINSFTAFVDSPYHNKSKKLILLLREIKKFHAHSDLENLNKEKLLKKISSELKYNDSTFRSLMFDLVRLAEKFMILEKLFDNEWEKNVYLLKSLTEKKNGFLFEKNLKKANLELEENGVDSVYFYNKSVLEMSKFNYNIINSSEKSPNNIENNVSNVTQYVVNLAIFFVTEAINSYLHLTVHEYKYKLPDKKNYLLKIIQQINIGELYKHIKKSSDHAYIIELYLSLMDSYAEMENPEKFLKYKSLVLKYSKLLSSDELSYHFSMLISYCIYKNSITRYRAYMDEELFKIYNIYLKGKYFLDRKTQYLDESLYRNILVLSLRIKKYKWTFSFIEEYSGFLHPDKQENLKNLSFADYYYHTGSVTCSRELLDTAFTYLKNIKEESFIVKHDIKILYLMLYYDLDYTDENMVTQLNNYRKFLRRNKLVSENRKKRLYKFLNLFEKLVFLKNGDHRVDISELYIDILKSDGLNHHQWLLNKVQQFGSDNSVKLKYG